jgi:hypothetical protein
VMATVGITPRDDPKDFLKATGGSSPFHHRRHGYAPPHH